jgi:serine phosphatase RsbU (regulator of sigma subunit)
VGSTLHLYTDGLIEHRSLAATSGMERLAEVAGRAKTDDQIQLRCQHIVSEMVDRPEDDVCLVLAQRR